MSAEFGKARPAQHKDLSAAFGGLLPRNEPITPAPAAEDTAPAVEPPTAVETPPSESPTAEKVASTETKAKKPARRKAAAGTEAAAPSAVAEISHPVDVDVASSDESPTMASDDKADQPIQISLPISLYSRLIAFKENTGLSHPNILFNAIENTAEQLPTLVKEKTVQLGSSTGTSLFSRPQTAVKRETAGEPKKSFIIRITKQNKNVLDTLVKQVEAPNRMVLIVAAYDADLPKLPTE